MTGALTLRRTPVMKSPTAPKAREPARSRTPTAPASALALGVARPGAGPASGGCACGGGCPRCRGGASALAITAPNDPLEREAESAAGVLVHGAVPPRDRPLRALPSVDLPAALPGRVRRALDGPARPLDAGARAEFEPRLGHDLGGVRVHAGDESARAARALDARAVAVGPHLLFGAGEYAPGREAGRRLLAHELAHVVQQGVGGFAALARAPLAAGDPPYTEVTLGNGVVLRTGHGWATLVVPAGPHGPEVQWASFEWDPQHEEAPDFGLEVKDTPYGPAYGLHVASTFEVVATLDRSIEDCRGSSVFTLFSYHLDFPGSLTVNGKTLTAPWRHRELYAPTPSLELPFIDPLVPPSAASLDPLQDATVPLTRPDARQRELAAKKKQDLVRGQPAFATRKAMEAYIRSHPGESFIGITTSYGRFVARKLDAAELRRLAKVARQESAGLEDVAWDAEQGTSAWGVTGVYHAGETLDAAALANLFFAEEWQAQWGWEGQLAEAEVFQMEGGMFGRRPLTHDQALARWRELDAYTAVQAAVLETEPGHPFQSLWVRGPGRFHEIGARYFKGRDLFRALLPTLGEHSGNLALVLESAGGDDVRAFLEAETDREVEDPTFRAALQARPELAAGVGEFLYQQAERRAQELALRAVTDAHDALAPLAEKRERAQAFVLGFADLSVAGQTEALEFIGVPERDRAQVRSMLADRKAAMRVALGLTERRMETYRIHIDVGPAVTEYELYSVSLDRLQEWAAETVAELGDAAEQFRTWSVTALKLKGPLGDRVRADTYRHMGFLALDPAGFPHAAESPGFRPDPLARGTRHFTTLGEQLYANHVSRMADEELVLDVLKGLGKAVLSALLLLVAQEAGVAATGLLWAEASSTVVAATEVVTSGVAFTLLNEGAAWAVEGRTESESLGGFAWNAAVNVATFGIFRALNKLLVAGTKAFVAGRMGEAGFTATRGAQIANGLRIAGMGTAFIGLALAQRLASGQGLPKGRELVLFASENLLNLALLEGGAVLAGPLMKRTGIWARSKRLGALEGEITALRGDIPRLQRDVAALAVNPHSAARDAPQLIKELRPKLERMKELAAKLKGHFSTIGDAGAEVDAGLEIELIETALQGLEQAEFLVAEQVAPVEGSESVFTYQAGEKGPQARTESVKRFELFYGEKRVKVDDNGTIRVEVPGLEAQELVFVPAELYALKKGPPTDVQLVVSRQQALAARQKALVQRADRLGIKNDPLIKAIRGLRPKQQTSEKTLASTEKKIAAAEKTVGAQIKKLDKQLLSNLRGQLKGEGFAQLRAGQLSGASDADLADVAWFTRGLQQLGVPELRALLFAHRAGGKPVDIPKLLARAKGVSVAERNFALESFGYLVESRVPGAHKLLAQMAETGGKFSGGLWAMEYMRYVVGIENVAAIELSVSLEGGAREYDVVLRDGTRLELKNWKQWYESSLLKQFNKDMVIATSNFTNPKGIRNLRYIFRDPAPRSVENTRAEMRKWLQNLLAGKGASPEVIKSMLDAFGGHAELVQVPVMNRTASIPLPPVQPGPVVPGFPGGRRDEEKEEDEE